MALVSRQTAVRLLARYPIHWLLPPGGLRSCGALLYHAERSSPERVTQLVRSLDGIPTKRLAVAMVASRAAFRAGRDDLLEPTLAELERRHPEAHQPLVLRADLLTYQGRYEQALETVERARILSPSSGPATARVVRLGYRVHDRERADAAAVDAVSRFPRHTEVLWAAGKACESPEQFSRLREAWQERSRGPADLLYAVRPLGLAAARARQVDTAIDLYRQAIDLTRAGEATPQKVVDTQLGGRGAWQAIVDLSQTLERAGVPFFFAAGTALGLVREGRPLSADSDIDIGVFDSDWDRDALIKLFTDHPRFDLDLHPQTQKVSLKHRGGSPVDVFRFYRDGDQFWHDGVFVRWGNSPFTVAPREIRGIPVPVPEDADRYLTENYGDWREPNAAFDAFTDDAPNVTVTWPEYQQLHFLRRAYKCLSVGDRPGAQRELDRAEVAGSSRNEGSPRNEVPA